MDARESQFALIQQTKLHLSHLSGVVFNDLGNLGNNLGKFVFFETFVFV